MPKQMIAWLYFQYPSAKRCIPPMRSGRLVQQHHRRLVRKEHIHPVRNQTFRMIVSQAEEPHSVDHAPMVLQKVHPVGQVLNPLRIPEAQIMIPCHK